MAENTGAVVVIPLERYNDLIQLETRVNVVVERVSHDSFMKTEDLLWILNTEEACLLAYEMRKQAEKREREWKALHDKREVENCEKEENH